jgi:hypothetical protein
MTKEAGIVGFEILTVVVIKSSIFWDAFNRTTWHCVPEDRIFQVGIGLC